jgi:hypothetical protein
VNTCGACNNRRWQCAIAIAVLSLLVALVAGTALPPKFVADGLPGPSHGPLAGGVRAAEVDRVQGQTGPRLTSHFVQASFKGAAPRNKNPFHGMWMTRDRPPVPSRLSPNLDSSSLPASHAAVRFSSAVADTAGRAAAGVSIWTQFRVARC